MASRTLIEPALGPGAPHPAERLAPAELHELQSALLSRQLAYVGQRSDFYQRKLREAGYPDLGVREVDDLGRLPFTSKDEIRESLGRRGPLGEHLAADPADVIQFHCSSGTTGRPSYVGLTAADLADWSEIQRRCLVGAGIRPGDRVLQGFGMSRGWVGGLPIVQGLQAAGAGVIPAGAEAGTNWILRVIKDLSPNAIACTPNFAVHLGEQAEEALGIAASELPVRKIAVGGEPGGGVPSLRDRADALWNAEMREMMGGGDICPVMWADCEERDGMHFMAPDLILFEIVSLEDQQPLPIEEGVVGELVYTHLKREATPLLRFRHADIVRVVSTHCQCGRTTPKIRCFGRADDMFIVKGVNVYPSAIQEIVVGMRPATTGGMVVVKETPEYAISGPLRIRVERSEDTAGDELRQLLEGRMREQLRCRVEVEILEPGTLPKPGRAKVSLIEKRYEEPQKEAP